MAYKLADLKKAVRALNKADLTEEIEPKGLSKEELEDDFCEAMEAIDDAGDLDSVPDVAFNFYQDNFGEEEEGDEEEEDEEDIDEDEDEEDDEEEEDEDIEEEDEDIDDIIESVKSMSWREITDFAKDNKIKLKKPKGTKLAQLRKNLILALEKEAGIKHEEEEEKKPAKKKQTKKKATKKKAKRESTEVDFEEVLDALSDIRELVQQMSDAIDRVI